MSDAREEEALTGGENDHLADRKEGSVLLMLKALFTRCIHALYGRKEGTTGTRDPHSIYPL